MLLMGSADLERLREAIALLRKPGASQADIDKAATALERLALHADLNNQERTARAARPDAAENIARMEACLANRRPSEWVAPVKLLRELTGLGLREAKDAVDSGTWRRVFERAD